ncbi:MAG: hypothetical protein IKV38_00680 [Clostridia bacterium]|nr:hypothetical protein [Clostridia bacterium]
MGFQLKPGDYISQDILTVIYINDQTKSIDFAMMTNKNKMTFLLKSTPFASNLFDADFFGEFSSAVSGFVENNPNAQNGGVAVVLPDKAVAQDSINLPIMKRNVMDNNFKVSYENLYKNHQDLKMNFVTSTYGKQYVQYHLSMTKKEILTALEAILTANKLSLRYFTSASASTLNAVYALKQKYKNDSFLILDVKQNYSRFVFNTKDRASGYYILPFGYDVLYQDQMPQEDMLFDHYMAELTVVNAKEKAKAKALTMAIEEEFVAKDDTDEEVEQNEIDIQEPQTEVKSGYLHLKGQTIKVLPKKIPRKLPKFMQREVPTTSQGFVYENFRLLVKWALTLLDYNPNVTQQGSPEFVLVNLPSRFNFVFEMVEKEQKNTSDGNAINFVELEQKDQEDKIKANLELFGGFAPLKSNAVNVF